MKGRRRGRTLSPGENRRTPSPPRRRPRPRPRPRPGQDPRGSLLVPTCRGPRRARLRVLTRFLPRHLRKQPAGTLLQTSGELSPQLWVANLGSAGCELRAGRTGRAGGTGMDTQLRARPRTFGFWGKERARVLTLWGLPRDVAKPEAGPPLSPPLRAATAEGGGAGAPAEGETARHSARPAPTRSRPAAAPNRGGGRRACPAPKLLP